MPSLTLSAPSIWLPLLIAAAALAGCALPAGLPAASAAGSAADAAAGSPVASPAAAAKPAASPMAATAPQAKPAPAVAGGPPVAGSTNVPRMSAPGPAPRPGAAPFSPAAVPAVAGAPASTPTFVSPPAPPAASGGAPPFATVIRDARRIEGALTLWQKDDRVWIELPPAIFGKPFLLSPKIRNGIGEAWLSGGLMTGPMAGVGGPQLVEFTRVHSQVRLLARNTDVLARAGTPEARAVEASYSASLLGVAPVVSAPHPETRAVLIEAAPIFLADMQGMGMRLQAAFRIGYGLDARNSLITAVRGSPQLTVIETQQHFYTANVSSGPGAQSSLPSFLPDTRSLLIGMHHSLLALPEQPMATRRADPRIGHFSSTVFDFSEDLARSPRTRFVHRWRLEKKDPAAELSEPLRPITFWIDRNVPLKYRDTVRSSILEWNKAFERIGFKDALRVEQQPDDAEWDTLDAGRPSVRWVSSVSPSFVAFGPSHVDPRSGEILDADIAFEGLFTRQQRTARSQLLSVFAEPLSTGHPAHAGHEACAYGDFAALQTAYAIEVLAARGELDPDGEEAQRFVLAYVKETLMHEVGHALGLRHNFRASRAFSDAQLSDPEFTRTQGTTGSVMDYNAVNLPRPGEPPPAAFQDSIGPYDFWAIEYAYKTLPAGSNAADEATELQRIASRSAEPLLAYGTDEDSFSGVDPDALPWDLGSDPVAYASKRLEIARDLFRRQEQRTLPADRDYSVLRRSLAYALVDVAVAVRSLSRQIGGVRTLRDFPGSGRDPLAPVPAAAQRRALDLISQSVLSAEALAVSPALQRRLAPDYLDRSDVPGLPLDYALPQRLLELQRGVLGHLLSDAVAARIVDSVDKADRAADAFQLSELYERLSRDLWSELEAGGGVSSARRELQREHLNRMAASLLRPASQGRADQRSLLRVQAERLLARIEAVQRGRRAPADEETRAHLSDGARTLRQALSAGLLRAGV